MSRTNFQKPPHTTFVLPRSRGTMFYLLHSYLKLAKVEILLFMYLRNDFITPKKVSDENIRLSVTDSSGTCIVAGSFALPLSSRKNTRVLRRFFSTHKARHQFSFAFISPPTFYTPRVLFLLLHNPLHLSASADILLRLVHGLMIFSYLALPSIFSSLTRLWLYAWISRRKMP